MALSSRIRLLPWQRDLQRSLLSGRYRVLAVSVPRGGGKTWFVSRLLARALTPGDRLYQRGKESLVFASSWKKGKLVWRFLKELLPERRRSEYRATASATNCAVVHRPTGTAVTIMSGSGKAALGEGALTNLLIGDEVSAWDRTKGALLRDALETSLGKPGSNTRLVYASTFAPAPVGYWWNPSLFTRPPRGWWTYRLSADPKRRWSWAEVLRVNPLARRDAAFKATLRDEFENARADPSAADRFGKFRLNIEAGVGVSEEDVLQLEDWEAIGDRSLPDRSELCVVGLDAGGSGAWSAATAVWSSGRVESIALSGSRPLAEQERSDRVSEGLYGRIAESGALIQDADRRHPRLELLQPAVDDWNPALIVCDFFRLAEVRDAFGESYPVESRRTRWSESTQDLDALARLAETRLALAPGAYKLVTLGLASSRLDFDTEGWKRVRKADRKTAKNDALAALVLACGALERLERIALPEWDFATA